MKSVAIFILIILTISCSGINYKYENDVAYMNKWYDPTMKKLNADNSDTSIVFLTGYFEKDSVQIRNGSDIIFNSTISTSPQIGLAWFEVVKNEKAVYVDIRKSKTGKIKLPVKYLKKYKFVYISDRDDKVLVEYTNKGRAFL
ncbi:hypothetical protein [Flavobacterium suncheonense]|uniref:Lipoprotein n=1 Tax=Flavobacterium suncheonense GH29-5 = DSM 17707 TaxID=1121899 RepID=A0A0A2LXH5_9FLAO|nr:hypothetical protein [Flavobacterium suncheonense]KGO84654.1 hypothetical protein Q764_14395 [Flavobacterium suncheonense GH29-5 = DSM 17707]